MIGVIFARWIHRRIERAGYSERAIEQARREVQSSRSERALLATRQPVSQGGQSYRTEAPQMLAHHQGDR